MKTEKNWARLLAYVTGLVNQELLLQNEYLAAENRILRAHLPSRLRLSTSRAGDAGGDRKEVGTESPGKGGLRCEAGHDSRLVPEIGGTEVRWLEAPFVSRAAANQPGG